MTFSRGFSGSNPPESICLLRLSALGDITHVLPTLRTLQANWPKTKITWIIGRTEYQLVKAIEGVHFITFDKNGGFSAYFDLKKQIKKHLDGASFDILLHMQLSIRASVASMFIPAHIKLGFDKTRAKDLQSLFCNQYIEPQSTRQHVLDSFLEFPKYFGLEPVIEWQLPVSPSAATSLKLKLCTEQKLFVINPCAVAKAKNWRNWRNESYAAVADIISEQYGFQMVLTGGNSQLEKDTAEEIMSLCETAKPINMIGNTSIDEMVALLDIAEVVLAPDTGPVHIASALGTKTVGLYASTNPQRAGPYNYLEHTANKYPQALLKYHQLTVADAPWGKRIKTAECMDLITVDEVIEKVASLLAAEK
jgi:heptosyltransferase I